MVLAIAACLAEAVKLAVVSASSALNNESFYRLNNI